MHVLVRDLEGNEELGCVCLSLQVWQSTKEPVEDVLQGTFFTMDNIAAIRWIEITWVTKNLKEAANSLLCLLLSFLLHIDRLMRVVKVGEDTVDEFEELKRCLVVKFDHTEMAHERGSVQAIHDNLDLLCVEVWCLGVDLLTTGLGHTIALSICCIQYIKIR